MGCSLQFNQMISRQFCVSKYGQLLCYAMPSRLSSTIGRVDLEEHDGLRNLAAQAQQERLDASTKLLVVLPGCVSLPPCIICLIIVNNCTSFDSGAGSQKQHKCNSRSLIWSCRTRRAQAGYLVGTCGRLGFFPKNFSNSELAGLSGFQDCRTSLQLGPWPHAHAPGLESRET